MATQLFQPPHGSPAWFHAMVAASQDSVRTEVVTLTPTLASELLKNNDRNRSVRQTKVQQYTADITAGRWVFNGEPLIVSRNGLLNDGQHRAYAVIDANTPIQTLIVFGVDRDSRTTIDQGGARGAADYAQMEGLQNAATATSIARMVMAFERANGLHLSKTKEVTNAEIMDRLYSDPKIAEAAHFAVGTARHANKYAAGTVLGFCFYMLSRINPGEAQAYMDEVCLGEGLRRGDPAHTVREKLLDEGKARDRKASIIFRGWNFRRRGRKVQPNGLKSTLPFPALI